MTAGSNNLADILEERDCHPTLLLPPGLQTLFFTLILYMFSHKMELIWQRYVFFCKSEKMSSQTVWLIKIKTISSPFLSYLAI